MILALLEEEYLSSFQAREYELLPFPKQKKLVT
jgi:hypothetical protein